MNFLTRYYGIRRMKIIVDGRRVGNGNRACYFENKAYFAKKGLNRRTILHEFYHHLTFVGGLEMASNFEERKANEFARRVMKNI